MDVRYVATPRASSALDGWRNIDHVHRARCNDRLCHEEKELNKWSNEYCFAVMFVAWIMFFILYVSVLHRMLHPWL